MSFGWSVVDIIAGLQLAYDIYQSVSNGPLNATHEAEQFFREFHMINECLEDWDRRRSTSQHEEMLLTLPLRKKCTNFIERHMRLIQEVNHNAGAVGNVRLVDQDKADMISTSKQALWLKKVFFTQDEVITLYQKVTWFSERKHVAELRADLGRFLGVATYRGVTATLDVVNDLQTGFRGLREDVRNFHSMMYKLSSNPNGATNLARLDPQPDQGEYSTQHQLESRPPLSLPFRSTELSTPLGFVQFDRQISPTTSWTQNPLLYDQSNVRFTSPGRVETMDTMPTARFRENSVALSQASSSSGSLWSTPTSTPLSSQSPFLGPGLGASPPIGMGSPVMSATSFQNSSSQNKTSSQLGSIFQSSSKSFQLDSPIPVTL